MESKTKAQALKEQIDGAVNSFENKREKNKKIAFRIYVGVAIINATITILLGLQGVPGCWLVPIRNVALILSATVTLLTSYDSFFSHRALWIRYTHTVSRLLELKARLNYLSLETTVLPGTDADRVFNEFESILEETNNWWDKQRDDNLPQPK